jgi:hypothetical protein
MEMNIKEKYNASREGQGCEESQSINSTSKSSVDELRDWN